MSLLLSLETFNHMTTKIQNAEGVSEKLNMLLLKTAMSNSLMKGNGETDAAAYEVVASKVFFGNRANSQYQMSIGHILTDDENCIGKRCWTLFGRIIKAAQDENFPQMGFTFVQPSYFEGEQESEIIAVMDNTSGQCLLVQYYVQPETAENGQRYAVGHTQTLKHSSPNDAMSQAGLQSLKLQNNPLWAVFMATVHMQKIVNALDTSAFDERAQHLHGEMDWSLEDLEDQEDFGYGSMDDWLQYIGHICSDTILLHGLLPHVTMFREARNHEVVLSAQTMMVDYAHGGAIVKLLEDMMETFVRTLHTDPAQDPTFAEMYHAVAQRVKTMVRETGHTYKSVVELLEMMYEPASDAVN